MLHLAGRMAEKAARVRQGAEAIGRNADGIYLRTMVARTIVGDDVGTTVDRETTTVECLRPRWQTRRCTSSAAEPRPAIVCCTGETAPVTPLGRS